MEIQHDKENHQYKMPLEDSFATVDYSLSQGKMFLTYSEVPVHLRSKGYGKILVEKTFEKLTEEGYKAVAVCSYVDKIARSSKKWNAIIE
ncbi:N-acetyltransferase [Arenibacter sp. 6A1]|uniref:GNAT family N-acetyltransferase n=1 Tax=Arenibacter sp. 6A1 TaxID=2720391 RepID=UPI001446F8A6|nr:N-acetyltransferase [Arenibacter sp. 6A1]NKI26057.1 N-acetyltransferase [Arenibacter sp. 6A1]